MPVALRMKRVLSLVILILGASFSTFAQTETATLSGVIQDPHGAIVPDVEITLTRIETQTVATGRTNGAGIYFFTGLMPGHYHMVVRKPGFKEIAVKQLELNVQDKAEQNFSLEVGSVSESVTVNASDLHINTTDAAVSTIVDRQFVENMPLNGRSFQDLLTLAPGVALVPSTNGVGYGGEISVNGQRTEANYFTVDGVSANTGTFPFGSIGGAGFSGGTPGETILGTTQSLVSIDALQEFRASTSTYSAEYGRTPGGQFSFSTRSGTNDWHGSAYDYFRNDVMDANNWFNNAANPQVPRLPERQNDFGGTLGGPIVIPGLYSGKDKTFFFFSYEGLRLTVPQPFQQVSVPDMTLRQQAPAALQPFLNAFPQPNGGEDGLNDGLAFFNQAYSAPSSLNNVGIRIDHSFGEKLKLFGRYANTPSSAWTLFGANKNTTAINVRSVTLGATSSFTRTQANELRFNFTQNNMDNAFTSTNFGGATPLSLSSFPGPNEQPFKSLGTQLAFCLCFGGFPFYQFGENRNEQRQFNVTDTYTWSLGVHQLKFGVDWRRLTTYINPITTLELGEFLSDTSVLANNADIAGNFPPSAIVPVEPVYHNFSAFVQDEWKMTSRLSLSLGLRWDINPAPGNLSGPSPYTVDQITNLATTQLAPENSPLWKTDWHGFAPRLGLAYQLRQVPGHETVVRAGFGLFYDLGSSQGSNGFNYIGFTSQASYSGVPFPLTSAQLVLPPASVTSPYNARVFAFDPSLKLPYTMQWNMSVEQALGAQQSLTLSYVGSAGRRLLSTFFYYPADNPNFSSGNGLYITSNRASSDYNALQVKYQKNLSHGLQSLLSYTFAHSIDDRSTNFITADQPIRGSSDFDIRHNFQVAITYSVPGNYSNPLASALLKNWGLDTRISARSALPIDIIGASSIDPTTQRFLFFHPDLVPGQPIYMYGSQYPGGRIINFNAFTPAPAGVEGDLGRNFARGFGAWQADLALRRDFPIHERLHFQFRAEAFNLFNHAIFGSIYNQLSYGPGQFGYAYNTLNSSLGGLNPLYQVGGPRSLQLALKLMF